MRDFNADDEFNELWSPSFGRHNGMLATQFYIKLKSDEQYFKKRADEIEADMNLEPNQGLRSVDLRTWR